MGHDLTDDELADYVARTRRRQGLPDAVHPEIGRRLADAMDMLEEAELAELAETEVA